MFIGIWPKNILSAAIAPHKPVFWGAAKKLNQPNPLVFNTDRVLFAKKLKQYLNALT